MTNEQAKTIKSGTPVVIIRKSNPLFKDFTVGKIYRATSLNGPYIHFDITDTPNVGNSWPIEDCELIDTELGLILYE